MIDWNRRVKNMGYKSVRHYFINRLPNFGTKGVAKEMGVSEMTILNKMKQEGVKKKIKYVLLKRIIMNDEAAINACIPEAEAMIDVPFNEAMNIITIRKGLRIPFKPLS